MHRPLGLLGLAKRAGHLAVGDSGTEDAIRNRRARLVCTAADASTGGVRRIKALPGPKNLRYLALPYTKAELGESLGRVSCAVVAFTDLGLAAGFVKALAAKWPEEYGETEEFLLVRWRRALRRKRETHRDTARSGKRRTK